MALWKQDGRAVRGVTTSRHAVEVTGLSWSDPGARS
jgi:hypothetical protein